MNSTAWVCNQVAKAAKVARAAVKAAPVAAATAPVAAGGIGIVLLGLGLWWAVNKAGQLPQIIGEKIQDLPEAVGKLDVPGIPDIPPVHIWVPDVVESVPEWDIPGLPELAPVWEWVPDVGPAVAQHYEEAGGSPFTGKLPGGPKFDLLAPFRGLFGGEGEPKSREYAGDLRYGEPKSRGYAADLLYGEPKSRGYAADLLYRGEPTETVNLPFKGESPELFYL